MDDNLQMIHNEITILHSLDHPNIIKYHEIFEDQRAFYISMELCKGHNLKKAMRQKVKMSEMEVSWIMEQAF